MTRVLVVSAEPVGALMAGPAIRALELARALSASHEVTLAAPAPSDAGDAPVELLEAGLEDFDTLLDALHSHDVVVAQQLPGQLLRHLSRLSVRYVADLYNPLVVEVLEALTEGAPRQRATVRRTALAVLAQCTAADYVICASEKQRDLWLGGLALAGLIEPELYRRDPTYRAFIDVVPFGVSEREPRARKPVLNGVMAGIGADDVVLLWGGGVWRWLDPFTPIRAVERLSAEGRAVHLLFAGVERPALDPAATPTMAQAAIDFARRRGLEGRCVHFNRDWVPYDERDRFLLESDIGVSAHHDHLEARFSFRSRVLDYLWAGLPVVTSAGDAVGELVEREGLGAAVAPGDDEGFARACAALLDDAGHRAQAGTRARELAASLRWSKAAAPLAAYCSEFRDRPVPSRRRATLALSTFGQYPAIAGELGPAETARRAGQFVSRAVRHLGGRR